MALTCPRASDGRTPRFLDEGERDGVFRGRWMDGNIPREFVLTAWIYWIYLDKTIRYRLCHLLACRMEFKLIWHAVV